MSLTLLQGRGIRQITTGLGTLDREVFEAVAESPSPLLDAIMPVLTRAADHSKLWFVIATALVTTRSPAVRRGAGRGLLSLAATSLLTNQVAKRLWRRPRPDRGVVPLLRRGRRTPTSNSLPSGHSASAAAFAVGVGLESPPVGLGLALLAGLVGLSRVATGAHYPGDVFAGFGIGAAVAVLGGKLVPRWCRPNFPPPNRCTSQHPRARPGRAWCWWSTPNRAPGPAPGSSSRCAPRCRRPRSSNSARARTPPRHCARPPIGHRCWPWLVATART